VHYPYRAMASGANYLAALLLIQCLAGALNGKAVPKLGAVEEEVQPDRPWPSLAVKRLYPLSETGRIRVLQVRSSVQLTGHKCKAQVTRKVSTCSYFGYSLGSRWVSVREPVAITPQECREAFSSGTWTFESVSVDTSRLPSGAKSFFSWGNLSPSGSCSTESFQRKGVRYPRAFEETLLEYEFSEVQGLRHLGNSSVDFGGGLRGSLSLGSVSNLRAEVAVWDRPAESCHQLYTSAYDGPAYILSGSRGLPHKEGVVFQNPDSGESLFLKLGDDTSVCGLPARQTQLGGLFVSLLEGGDPREGRFQGNPLGQAASSQLSLRDFLSGREQEAESDSADSEL